MSPDDGPAPDAARASGRRSVAGRLSLAFAAFLAATAVAVGVGAWSLRATSREAELVRAGYAPLLLRLGEARAEQNVLGAQLNHIPTTTNATDVRDWLETVRRTRPVTLERLREAAEQLERVATDDAARALAADVKNETQSIERADEGDRFGQLYRALSAGDRAATERARSALVAREADTAAELRALRTRVEERMEAASRAARSRERQSQTVLLALAFVALLVGVLVTLTARRILAPLGQVVARAGAVARGELEPRPALATPDELGELSRAFEEMVQAIRRARAELVQAERLAAMGAMAAHVTHEIRNPLSSLGLNAELLEEELATLSGDRGEAEALLRAMRAEVTRLSALSEQYLSLARRREPRLEDEHPARLVRGLAEFLRPEFERSGLQLHTLIDEAASVVRTDEALLRQALVNLVRNAREASPPGGTVRLVVEAREGEVEFAVEDDGPGIPADARARLFDPFFTTKERGTGLGLAITREVVAAHGGSLGCDDRPSGGTRFWMRLPPSRSAQGSSRSSSTLG
jgi:two-component system NtrC family sensor kinase